MTGPLEIGCHGNNVNPPDLHNPLQQEQKLGYFECDCKNIAVYHGTCHVLVIFCKLSFCKLHHDMWSFSIQSHLLLLNIFIVTGDNG